MSDFGLKSLFSTTNQALLHSFEHCVDLTSERFIRYVEPQPDGKIFSIVFKDKREGITTFEIQKITLTVSGGGPLSVQAQCDFKESLPWTTKTNSISLVCQKNAEDTVVVNAITSAGNITPVVVPAVPLPGPTITDRVAAVENSNEVLASELGKLREDLQASIQRLDRRIDGIALQAGNAVPYGTDANGGASCPDGYYVVAVNIHKYSGGGQHFADGVQVYCRALGIIH